MVRSHIIELNNIIDPHNEAEVRSSGVMGVFLFML